MAASPAKTVRARLDEQSTRALAILTAKGQTESQAVRGALFAAADAGAQDWGDDSDDDWAAPQRSEAPAPSPRPTRRPGDDLGR